MTRLLAAAVILAAVATAWGQNQYLEFDGDDLVIIPNSASLNPSQITVECRARFDTEYSPIGPQMLVMKGGDWIPGEYSLGQMGSTGPGVYFDFDWRKDVGLSAPLEVGRWYHVAGTYDGNAVTVD